MEDLFAQNLWEGVKQFFAVCEWMFVALFMLWAWLLNKASESEGKYVWLNWYAKIPKGIRVLSLGIVLAVVYAILFNKVNKDGISSLFFSITVAMVSWNVGINTLDKWINRTK